MNKQTLLFSALFSLVVFSNSSFAEGRQKGQRDGQKNGPPPEAIEACSNVAEGASCQFTGRHGEELTGICFIPSEGENTLACKPEGHDSRSKK